MSRRDALKNLGPKARRTPANIMHMHRIELSRTQTCVCELQDPNYMIRKLSLDGFPALCMELKVVAINSPKLHKFQTTNGPLRRASTHRIVLRMGFILADSILDFFSEDTGEKMRQKRKVSSAEAEQTSEPSGL